MVRSSSFRLETSEEKKKTRNPGAAEHRDCLAREEKRHSEDGRKEKTNRERKEGARKLKTIFAVTSETYLSSGSLRKTRKAPASERKRERRKTERGRRPVQAQED